MMEQPDDETQAHLAIKRTEAGQALSEPERTEVANALISGKIGELKSPQMREALVQALVGLGVTSEFLAEKIREGLEADETKYFQHEGNVTDERQAVAWAHRHSYLRTALKLMGVEGGGKGVRVSAKNFIYQPMLRGTQESISVEMPKETVLKRRMAAAKHNARQVPDGE
jgi:hypothetical protein